MDWKKMIDMISNSVVASPLVNYKVQILKGRNDAAMSTVEQMAKDLDIALDTARAMNVPIPITALTRQLYGAMKARGKGGMNFFGLVTLMEEIGGIKS